MHFFTLSRATWYFHEDYAFLLLRVTRISLVVFIFFVLSMFAIDRTLDADSENSYTEKQIIARDIIRGIQLPIGVVWLYLTHLESFQSFYISFTSFATLAIGFLSVSMSIVGEQPGKLQLRNKKWHNFNLDLKYHTFMNVWNFLKNVQRMNVNKLIKLLNEWTLIIIQGNIYFTIDELCYLRSWSTYAISIFCMVICTTPIHCRGIRLLADFPCL